MVRIPTPPFVPWESMLPPPYNQAKPAEMLAFEGTWSLHWQWRFSFLGWPSAAF